jgi:hypothetical protein
MVFGFTVVVLFNKSLNSGSKSQRLLLLDFGEVVGFDEVLDELFEVFGVESKESDDVESIFFGDGVVDFVFLDETTDLGELFL